MIKHSAAYRNAETQRIFQKTIEVTYLRARTEHWTRQKLAQELQTYVWQSPDLLKAPERVRAYLTGYDQALLDTLMDRDVIHEVFLPDANLGTWVSTKRATPDQLRAATKGSYRWRGHHTTFC